MQSLSKQPATHPAPSQQILAPGSILQLMYLKERISLLTPGNFEEVGAGQGHVTRVLLERNWSGTAYDLNAESLAQAEQNNIAYVERGLLKLQHGDWLQCPDKPADLVVSSLVVEHLSDELEHAYFRKCARNLRDGGKAIVFVPGSPQHWGIEDEIAGHYRRYTPELLSQRMATAGLRATHCVGLTYPLSNLLYPLSSFLVKAAESNKQQLSMRERTKLSGNRKVPGKTSFPQLAGLLLNETMMQPWHLLQKAFAANASSLILYAEAERA